MQNVGCAPRTRQRVDGAPCAPYVLIGAVFWWAVRRRQFDDLEGPAHRILMDDDRARGG